MTGKDHSDQRPSAPRFIEPRKRSKKVDFEGRLYRIASLGAIVSGILVCLASVGAGMGLMLVGTVILAEL